MYCIRLQTQETPAKFLIAEYRSTRSGPNANEIRNVRKMDSCWWESILVMPTEVKIPPNSIG
jgi:hypothetical protein